MEPLWSETGSGPSTKHYDYDYMRNEQEKAMISRAEHVGTMKDETRI